MAIRGLSCRGLSVEIPMTRLLEALRSGRVLLMDGAMGTQLLEAGVSTTHGLAAANLFEPDHVFEVHRAYVAAGAEVLLTNTFQAFPAHLRECGIADRLEEIIRAGVSLARRAVGIAGYVLGDIGPGEIDREGVRSLLPSYKGVDGFLIETASDTALLEIVRSVLDEEKDTVAVPVLFSATYLETTEGIRTVSGYTPQALARRATDLGAAALGVNCGKEMDLARCAAVLEEYRRETTLPLFARPNAGTPWQVESCWKHPLGANAMAEGVEQLINAGAEMIGGCCGTSPEYIARCWEKVRLHNKRAGTGRV